MQCEELNFVGDITFKCRNPASVIAREYKSGVMRGLCTHCILQAVREDDTFLNRNDVMEMD